MGASSVSLIRPRIVVALAACFAVLATPAFATQDQVAEGGGANVPGATTPAGSSVSPTDPSAVATTPATLAETIVAASTDVQAPALLTPLRRPADPVTTDLTGLRTPSAVATIDGHVIFVRQRGGRSELVDLAAGAATPRILLSSTRTWGTPNAGHDSTGRPVVIASPCAGVSEVILLRRAPNCPLRLIDLETGASRPVPGSAGALQGDIAGSKVVFVRQSPSQGSRLYVGDDQGIHPVALPALNRAGDGWVPALGRAVPYSVTATSLDIDASGTVALVLRHRSPKPYYSSGLWVRRSTGGWSRIVSINTDRTDLGVREVLGPRLSDDGVEAYVEGVVSAPSFVGRWTYTGQQTTKLSVRRSVGRATILRDAAFDGQRLVFVDWLPGLPCGAEGADACGLRSVGPLTLR